MKFKFSAEAPLHILEKIIYIFIALTIAASALFLIVGEVQVFMKMSFTSGKGTSIVWIADIISKSLLLLMLAEIIHTVRISFKNQALMPEPFLTVALIAIVRRILHVSVETSYKPEIFSKHMVEMGVLGLLIMIFVVAIILLKKHRY